MLVKLRTLLIFGLFSTSVVAFDAGEHALLGDKAMQRYFPDYPNAISNLEADIQFRYGHLIAMSADMYKSVEELALDEPKYLKDYYLHNRKKLKACIDKEVNSILNEKTYQKCSETRLIKRKFRYLTLAHDNYTHFAWHNLKEYIRYHERALWFAQLAYLKCTNQQWKTEKAACETKRESMVSLVRASHYKKKLSKKYKYLKSILARRRLTQRYLIKMPKETMLELALFHNAYADHFLTDAFSAGHLRIPRSQIDAFVEQSENLKQINWDDREDGSVLSGALTQYLHNLDGHKSGIEVTNTRGDEFYLRGDKQLFAKHNTIELADKPEKFARVNLAIEAVGLSLGEVFRVYQNGKSALTNDKFTALNLVPFVDLKSAPDLQQVVAEHIKQSGSAKNALDRMSPEMKNLYRGVMLFEEQDYDDFFVLFSRNLNKLMAGLRAQIKLELEDKSLKKRLPDTLIKALVNIN